MCEVLSHETRIPNGLKGQTFQGADFPEKQLSDETELEADVCSVCADQ